MFDYKEMKKLMFLNEILKHCGDTGMDVTIKRNPIYIKIKDIEVNEVDNKMVISDEKNCKEQCDFLHKLVWTYNLQEN